MLEQRLAQVDVGHVLHDADDGVPVGARAAEGAHLPADRALGILAALEFLVDHGDLRRLRPVGGGEHPPLPRRHANDVEETR